MTRRETKGNAFTHTRPTAAVHVTFDGATGGSFRHRLHEGYGITHQSVIEGRREAHQAPDV
jgi:hypothetical protein